MTDNDNRASNDKSRPTFDDNHASGGGSCPTSVVIVREGQLCPNCRFAKLVREPGNIIQCPICGYGTTARYT